MNESLFSLTIFTHVVRKKTNLAGLTKCSQYVVKSKQFSLMGLETKPENGSGEYAVRLQAAARSSRPLCSFPISYAILRPSYAWETGPADKPVWSATDDTGQRLGRLQAEKRTGNQAFTLNLQQRKNGLVFVTCSGADADVA